MSRSSDVRNGSIDAMRACLLLAALVFGLSAAHRADAQERRAYNPPGMPPATGYSHVVVAPKGRIVHISGQVGLDEHGTLAGEDFEAQCVQAHRNVERALVSLGLTFRDVVRTDNYITDAKYLPVLREVRKRFLPDEGRPVSTLLVVSGLFRPDLLFEVSVVAVLPDAGDGTSAEAGDSTEP